MRQIRNVDGVFIETLFGIENEQETSLMDVFLASTDVDALGKGGRW